MAMRAIVIGAGSAGEGHVVGLREAGVEVVAMCGRTPEPAYAMAKQLGVEEVRFDWREAIEEYRPDIVSIATPAHHSDMTIVAVEHGCHVACEKPLGLTAEEARSMLKAVENAGVKHAYAATHHCDLAFAHAEELLSGGLIGRVREIEYRFHLDRSPLLPYHWSHQLRKGGGSLYASLTHGLTQLRRATGATVIAATGEARTLIDRAPIGPEIHYYRDLSEHTIDPEQAEACEWGVVDSDQAYTVLLELQMPGGHKASALFQSSIMAPSPIPNYFACYGTDGAIHMPGSFLPERVEHFSPERGTWEEIPIPQRLIDALPHHENRSYRVWNQFFREFVADIQGEGFAGYPTFRDGWVDNQVIDVVLARKGWTVLSQNPGDST